MENLVSCQYLPYIISLLDSPQQVLRCMRVCRGLYQNIKANFNLFCKFKVDLSIDSNLRSMGGDPIVYSITCFSAKGGQDPARGQILFNYKCYANKTILESRTREGEASYHIMPSSGALDSFNKILQRQLYKFEYREFRVDEHHQLPRMLDNGMSTSIVDYVKQNGITSDSCLLNTAPGFELLGLLGGKICTIIKLIGDEYEKLPLIAKSSYRVVIKCDCGPEPSLLPIRQILKDWESGSFHIVNLSIRYIKDGPTLAELLALLEEFAGAQIEHHVESEYIRAVLNRQLFVEVLYIEAMRNFGDYILRLYVPSR